MASTKDGTGKSASKRTAASAKTGTRSSSARNSKAASSKRASGSKNSARDEDVSLIRLFFQSKGGRLSVMITLAVLTVVVTLLLTGDDPQRFFRVTGIEILLAWAILVIFSLARRRSGS